MVRKPDIQYIQFYTNGSAARQLQQKPIRQKKYALSKAPRRDAEKRVIRIDQLAWGGIIISAVMLLLMIVGTVELFTIRNQADQMEQYVAQLYAQNTELRSDYESGYDLDEIQRSAHAMGLVPIEEKTITVSIPEQGVRIAEPDMWQRLSTFFQELFA